MASKYEIGYGDALEKGMAAVRVLLTKLESAKNDAAEWKKQHENLLAMFRTAEQGRIEAKRDLATERQRCEGLRDTLAVTTGMLQQARKHAEAAAPGERNEGGRVKFTKRDQRMFDRLAYRSDILRIRLEITEMKNVEDITQELHALDWALARLSNELLPAAPGEKG